MSYCVYKHTCPNGKVYVGITSKNPIVRWAKGNGYNHNTHFHNAILKYGWNNIKHEILYTDLSKEEACEKEIELIAEYKSNNPDYGYNLSSGGESGFIGCHPSEEARRKMSEAHKLIVGEKHHLYGTHRSEITKEKLRIANLGANSSNAKSIICVETGEIFGGVREAARKNNVTHTSIIYAAKHHKTHKGYHWRYIDE